MFSIDPSSFGIVIYSIHPGRYRFFYFSIGCVGTPNFQLGERNSISYLRTCTNTPTSQHIRNYAYNHLPPHIYYLRKSSPFGKQLLKDHISNSAYQEENIDSRENDIAHMSEAAIFYY